MRVLSVVAILVLSLSIALGLYAPAAALNAQVMISQIKAGNSSASRLVEIYNNFDMPLDLTDWCVYYGTPSSTVPTTKLGCFSSADPAQHWLLPPRSYALLASSQTGLTADKLITEGMGNGTSGHVYLLDSFGNEVDRVGWGTVDNPETAAIVLGASKVVERRGEGAPAILIDTDNNSTDFVHSNLRVTYQHGMLYPLMDACLNIEGFQAEVPSTYSIGPDGTCHNDLCPTIDGIQDALPYGYETDGMGGCFERDVCINLPGNQIDAPEGYVAEDWLRCVPLPIITELLPNVTGADAGKEFIELYNPGYEALEMSNYTVRVGSNDLINFASGTLVSPQGYLALSNADYDFTLPNTSVTVKLAQLDGTVLFETVVYVDPKDDIAWALIDGTWQYTDQPTPGAVNVASLMEEFDAVDGDADAGSSDLKPCAPNQYRSLETNRCRLIVSSSSSTSAPCSAGQERNSQTNRCRNIATSDEPAACKEGQERNPETNRCRNIVAMPPADYGVLGASSTAEGPNYLWWIVGGVGVLALGYAGWQWHREIAAGVRRAWSFVRRRK